MVCDFLYQVKSDTLKLALVRRTSSATKQRTSDNALPCREMPVTPYVNVTLHEAEREVTSAVVLLQNPYGKHTLTSTQLTQQVLCTLTRLVVLIKTLTQLTYCSCLSNVIHGNQLHSC